MQNENPERCGRACPSWVCLQTQNDTFTAASKVFERMMSLRTQRGVNLKVIQELAGHKSIATTSKYAHLDKKSLVEALALLNRDGD